MWEATCGYVAVIVHYKIVDMVLITLLDIESRFDKTKLHIE